MNDVSSAKSIFREVFKLLKIALTTPVATATAVQTLSAPCFLKKILHSTMSQPKLNHVMLLHAHKERTDSLDLKQIARDLVSVNEMCDMEYLLFVAVVFYCMCRYTYACICKSSRSQLK